MIINYRRQGKWHSVERAPDEPTHRPPERRPLAPPSNLFSVSLREQLLASGQLVPREPGWWINAQPCLRLTDVERRRFEWEALTSEEAGPYWLEIDADYWRNSEPEEMAS